MFLKLPGWFVISLLWCFGHGKDLTIQTVSGTVGADNYTYYALSYEGPISLVLESIEGDADLYISQYLLHPSYNLSEYCLNSATCGLDRIDIPSSFRRPLGVAVYGHSLYPYSAYKLTVLLRDEPNLSDLPEDSDSEYSEQEVPEAVIESIHRKAAQHSDEQSIFTSMLWTFLEILLEVLFA